MRPKCMLLLACMLLACACARLGVLAPLSWLQPWLHRAGASPSHCAVALCWMNVRQVPNGSAQPLPVLLCVLPACLFTVSPPLLLPFLPSAQCLPRWTGR
jgi:hypothetical protein